ncbi:MAG: radical SAM protein [Chloroflexota bacterium]|nr:radical SAM protein [Chloroflexota bacterium]
MRLLLVEIAPADQRDARLTAGLGYIAAYVRREIPEVKVQIIKGDPTWVERAVKEYHPEVVGLSTVSQYYCMAVEAADICHRLGAFVVIGGHHVSALPGSMTPSMKLGVMGEGEDTMLDICRTFLDKGPDRSAFAAIPGTALLDGPGQSKPRSEHPQMRMNIPIVMGEPRPLHKSLDDFAFPARDLMHVRHGESVGIITSRGCPYRCVFCASSAFWKRVRFHSAEYVVTEIKEVVERYRTPHIYFWDDLFVADFERIKKITALLQHEPALKGTKFSCTCRANLANDELARVLKEMNVIEVMIGFESMAPDTLRYLKPHVTVEHNRQAMRVFHQHEINVTGFFVIGSPKETHEEIEQTLDFVRTAPLYRAEAYLLTPLPGTPVWEYALQRGLIDPDNVPWERLYIDNPDDPKNGIYLSETMSAKDLRRYWHEFQRVRQRKDRINLLRRVPQHLAHFLQSPLGELAIISEQLRTRRQGHI